ncbi:unnamed protein product [Calypogeia fissa]
MPHSGNMTNGNSEQRVKEEDAVAFTSSEQALSTLAGETPFAGVCKVEINAGLEPICSTMAAEFPVREEKMMTQQASSSCSGPIEFPIWEEKEQTSDKFVSLWSEAIQRLGDICSMEFSAPTATTCTTEEMKSTGREEKRRTSHRAVNLSEVVEDFIGGLENLCLLEDRRGVHNWRSPLPTWYPRRPLQDITAVLNNAPVQPEEASNLKKPSKKAQAGQLHGYLHDNRGAAFGQQRTPRVPFKPTSLVAAAPKRSSLLRKGFR